MSKDDYKTVIQMDKAHSLYRLLGRWIQWVDPLQHYPTYSTLVDLESGLALKNSARFASSL